MLPNRMHPIMLIRDGETLHFRSIVELAEHTAKSTRAIYNSLQRNLPIRWNGNKYHVDWALIEVEAV